MEKQIDILGKEVTISLSNSAIKALSHRDKPLIAEMELYFSCLIRKQVRFKENMVGDLVNVVDELSVRFRPVMTKACGIDYEGEEPPVEDFPIQ